MIKVTIKIGIDQISEIEHHSEVEFSMDRIIEEGCNIRGTQNYRKSEFLVDIEVIIEITILEEVEVGLGKESIQVILEGMIEALAVDLDQV